MSKSSYTFQFSLNETGQRVRDSLSALIVERLCEHYPILGVPGQSILVSGPTEMPTGEQIQVKIELDPSQKIIEADALVKAAASCALVYGQPDNVSGWIHHPASISYSDDPEGEYFNWKSLDQFVSQFNDEPIALVDDTKLKFYLKYMASGLSHSSDHYSDFDKLQKAAVIGSDNEVSVIKGYLSKVNDQGTKVSRQAFTDVINLGDKAESSSAFLQYVDCLPRMIDFSYLGDDFDSAFKACVEYHMDEIKPEAIELVTQLLGDYEFVSANKEDLKEGFGHLSFSNVVDLYVPESDKRTQVINNIYEHLESLDAHYCRSLSPF